MAAVILAAVLAVQFSFSTCLDGCILEEELMVCMDRFFVEEMRDLLRDGDEQAVDLFANAALLMFRAEGENCTYWEAGTEI
ncbi:MAG: hypothetical protein OYL41_11065 [Acidobacteriota bacterium]|nr:hypothetical protein [Acidobacteriota bacterium]